MSKEIHIQGVAKNIQIVDELSDNYDLDAYFDFEEETTHVIENCMVQIWSSDHKTTLKEAKEGEIRQMLGEFTVSGQSYGYSEYTIEGFDVTSAVIGNHELQNIVDSYGGKYLHIVITQGNLK